MRAVLVIVANIVRQQPFHMAFIRRDHMIQQVSSAAFDPTLREREVGSKAELPTMTNQFK